MRVGVLVALGVGLASATPSFADDAAKKDAEQLRGRWAAVGAIDDDGKLKAVAEDDPRYFTFEFTGDKLITRRANRTIEGTYKLDPSKQPKAIDVVRRRGGAEVLFQGIYAVDGDRLRVCLAGTGNGRPKEFKQAEGIEFAVELKRAKP
jgi:uncharacterized protein (TIGR03067 family)